MNLRSLFHLARADDRDTLIELPPKPEPFTREHHRCIEVERRLNLARMGMVARGTKLLLMDRPAWKRVTGGNVITMRGR